MSDPDHPNSDPIPVEPTPPPVVDTAADAPSPELPVEDGSCPQCQAGRLSGAGYCGDCGYIFTAETAESPPTVVPEGLINGRYQVTEVVSNRGGVVRFRGEDVGGAGDPLPIIVFRQTTPPPGALPPRAEDAEATLDFDLLPDPEQPIESDPPPLDPATWPGVAWEQGVLLRAAHLSLPRLLDSFSEDGFDYLVVETPVGMSLWDAWDREEVTNRERFAWLVQLAEAIERLHVAGAILEGLRPEKVVISPSGLAILADVSDLLPLPMPADAPLRGGFETAPELLLNPGAVDERADLYTFGALVYALLFGRELSDLDFTLTGMPRPLLERVPDANPFLARLLARTFVRDPDDRFPTMDGAQGDRTGYRELIAALHACRRNLDRVKLDVAGWSTIGMVRSGNEDALVIHHQSESRLNDSDEAALILLADGMGGMESGEVAAALTLQTLREHLFAAPPFARVHSSSPVPEDLLAPNSGPTELSEPASPAPEPEPEQPLTSDAPEPEVEQPLEQLAVAPLDDTEAPERTPDAHAERVAAALREANRRVLETAQSRPGTRGMGCTAELVLIDGGTAILGHVGDSRVYRMRRGKLSQITRDHTLVGRLVELGQITEAEAETHPRRSELHQAIGGRPDVYPDVYSVTLEPGDWLLICSDGLTNQVEHAAIQATLREARNAERAARRLVNQALADGAVDNVTVAVVRVS